MADGVNGLHLGLVEPSRIREPLQQLPDELDPAHPTDYGGGNWVPRSMRNPELLVLVAELLQEDLAEDRRRVGSRPTPVSSPSPPRSRCRPRYRAVVDLPTR